MTPNYNISCSYQSMGADVDEEDEALSFCDIPLYSDASADSSAPSSSEQSGNLFEFFSSGFPATAYQPAENFVFCGRLIPYGDSPSPSPSKKKQRVMKNGAGGGGSRSSSVKGSRWYKVMFGSMRLPGEMDIADIKSRQRRHPIPKAPKAVFGIMYEDKDDHHQRKNLKKNSSPNGLIGLVRSLSCRGYCSTAILN